MIQAVLAAWFGSSLVAAVVYQIWLDSAARLMGENVIFNAGSALFLFPIVLAYTAVIGIPVGLAAYWLLNKAKLRSLWIYLVVGLGISLALVFWRESYGLSMFTRPGSDGVSLAIIAVGITAPLIFWMIRVQPERRVAQ